MSLSRLSTACLARAMLASCSAAALLGITTGAAAQTRTTTTTTIEEVTVTALRSATRVTDTPASVTAIGASTIEAANIERPHDFIALTPGVSLVAASEVGDTQVNIRGINGARDAENSFAFILDGILMSNPAAFNREFADLQQIEILKGPQGALYGRNAAAGAIVVTTKKPGNEYEGFFKGEYSTGNTKVFQGALGGPIVKDKVLAKIDFDVRDTDGLYFNRYRNDRSVDYYTGYNVNGRVILNPSDALTIDIKARYGHVDGGAINFNAAFELPGFAALAGPLLNENVNTHQFEYVGNVRNNNDQRSKEASIKADYDLGWGKLSGWLLYSDIDNNFITDGTVAGFGFYNRVNPSTGRNACAASLAALAASGYQYPAPQGPSLLGPYTSSTCDGYQYQQRNERDVSFEIRLSSNSDQRFRWSGGIYYLNIDRDVGVAIGDDAGTNGGVIPKALYQPYPSPYATAQLFHDSYKTNVYAAFVQGNYDITKDFEFLGALRYDIEERSTHNLVPISARQPYIDLDGNPNNLDPLNAGILQSPGGISDKKKTFAQLEPKAVLRWHAMDEVNLYASYGVGFKSGGFNSAGTSATVAALASLVGSNVRIPDQYNKETSNAFELGAKGRLLDGLVTYSAAAFYTKVDDMQFFEFFSGPSGLFRTVSNIDRVELKGYEIGVNVQPAAWIVFNGGFSRVLSRIEQNSSRPTTVGNRSPYTPAYTANLAVQVNLPVTDRIEAFGRVDANFIGSTWFHTVQAQNNPALFGLANYTNTRRDPYETVNLRVGGKMGGIELAFVATNIFDKHYLEEVIPAPEFGGAFIHDSRRRTLGVQGIYKF